MKFLIVGDLHGHMPRIYYRDFDAIIAPGDFCSDGLKKYVFENLRKNLDNPKYGKSWYEAIGKRKAKLEIKKSIADGRKILEFLNSFKVPVFIVPGNWDWTPGPSDWNFLEKDHYSPLIRGLSYIHDVHYARLDTPEFAVVGHGISSGPEFPQHKKELASYTKKELRVYRKEYKITLREIGSLFRRKSKPIIFITHNVPFNTRLDKITNKKSPRFGLHYGSVLARDIIEKHQPLVCIGGHMHEHFGKCRIRKTTVINAGFGSKVNVLLEVTGGIIKQLEFRMGNKRSPKGITVQT